RTSPDAAQARLRNARLMLALGQPDLAIDRAQPLLNNASTAQAARVLLAQAHIARKAPEQAERVLKDAVDAKPQDPAAFMHLGRFYLARNRAREAVGLFDRAAAARADAAEPLIAKAEAQAALGDSQAVATAERVVKLQGDSIPSYLFLAGIQERLARNADALK